MGMGSGARACDSQSHSRETLAASRRIRTPRARSLNPPGALKRVETGSNGKRGPKDLKDTAVERRIGEAGLWEPVACPCNGQVSAPRRTALRSLCLRRAKRELLSHC